MGYLRRAMGFATARTASGGPRDRACHVTAHGVEAQFYQNEELLIGRRFDRRMDPTRPPRALAVQWAEEERKAIERG